MVRLIVPDARYTPNVALLSGLHWHISEEALLRALPVATRSTITSARCFADTATGASLGIFFVEFSTVPALYDFINQRFTIEGCRTEAALIHMTAVNWDRSGRLPDLPPSHMDTFDRAVEGYGREGFAIRGVGLCLPNTLTEEGAEAMDLIRKRLRVEVSN